MVATNENYIRPEFDESIVLEDNAMLRVRPELFDEWDFDKNSELGYSVYKVTKGSGKVAWWKCMDCGSIYDMRIAERSRGSNCPYCSGHRINEINCLANQRPDLASEWDYERNKLTPNDVTCRKNEKTWWICNSCNESLYLSIYERVKFNRGCKECIKKESLKNNSLAVRNPILASQWHSTLNGELTPKDVLYNESIKAWWKCEKGHKWNIEVFNRHNGSGCPYCSGRCVWVGFNDLWTTHPEVASMLFNNDDGYKYSFGSDQKVDWKCPYCSEVIKNKQINMIVNYNFLCPNCSDGISLPEKVMYHLLKQLSIDFVYDTTFKWSGYKRYDFYLPKNKMIIEVHGSQHYARGFTNIGGRTLEEEQENDLYKKELALKNEIDKYITIDCRRSDFEFIKNNIISSELNSLFNLLNVNWDKVNLESSKSFVFKCSELWNEGYSVKEISEKMKIDRNTTTKYLNKGKELNINSYKYKIEREIVQLDSNSLSFIKKYESITEASKQMNGKPNNITRALKNNSTAYGYRWLYKEDYEEFLNGVIKLNTKGLGNMRGIIQLTLDGEYITRWISITEAMNSLGFKSSSGIRGCCSGKLYSAGGFKWMYEEDYEDYLIGNKSLKLPHHLKYKKGIVQLDLEGNLIKEWKTFNEICKYLNRESSNIIACCKGRLKKAYGYKWMYKEDYDELEDNK